MSGDAKAIFKILSKTYPHATCDLNFKNPLELVVASVLSAQCTDKRVNQVTPQLFKKYKTARAYGNANIHQLEDEIRSIGLFRAKARNIKALGMMIDSDYKGKVPNTLDELVKLPGVGRKTANVVLGHAFDIPGITVDTHFGRLSRRFGWTKSNDPVKIEHEVGALFPKKNWVDLSQRMVWHGRRICHSRKPACGACPLAFECPSFGIGEIDTEKAKKLVKRDEDFR
jgi:endonuclease-3